MVIKQQKHAQLLLCNKETGKMAIKKQKHAHWLLLCNKETGKLRNGNRLSKWANILKLDAHAKLQMVDKFPV